MPAKKSTGSKDVSKAAEDRGRESRREKRQLGRQPLDSDRGERL